MVSWLLAMLLGLRISPTRVLRPVRAGCWEVAALGDIGVVVKIRNLMKTFNGGNCAIFFTDWANYEFPWTRRGVHILSRKTGQTGKIRNIEI